MTSKGLGLATRFLITRLVTSDSTAMLIAVIIPILLDLGIMSRISTRAIYAIPLSPVCVIKDMTGSARSDLMLFCR